MEDPRYHIRIQDPEKVGKYVLLPGDRGRVKRIAKYLENAEVVGDNREYFTMTGYLNGEKVSVMSTGMGAPCMSIGVEEIKTLGVHTFIRIGTTGAMQPNLKLGDSIIPTAAIRGDGTMDYYLPKAFPAVGHFEVIEALKEAAGIIGNPHHLGVVLSTDSYYGRFFNSKRAAEEADLFVRANTLSIEMEVSALYILGNVHNLRTGAILTIREELGEGGSYVKQAGEEYEKGMEKSIQIAIKAIELLIKKDKCTA